MSHIFSSLIAGLLFGIGLVLSGMIDPEKVLNFLDFTDNWDPSLAFVMAGALLVSIISFRYIPRRTAPVFEKTFKLPTRKDINLRLCLGSALFGIGWGLAGFCPGPVISSLAVGSHDIYIFLFSMLAGFAVHKFIPE